LKTILETVIITIFNWLSQPEKRCSTLCAKVRSLAPTIPKKFRKKYSGIGTPAAFVLNAMS
jgi:hypothetical protein